MITRLSHATIYVLDQDEALKFYRDKLTGAKYWMERMIPECPMLLERISAGSATIMEIE